MRFTETLRKKIIHPFSGAIVNRFKLRERRDVVFFADIVNHLIKKWEREDPELLESIGREWMAFYMKSLLPDILKNMPITMFMNTVMKSVWKSLGLLDDMKAENDGDVVILKTLDEDITNEIGKNHFLPGLYAGILSVFTGKEVVITNITAASGKVDYNVYVFSLTKKPFDVKPREKELYNRLNKLNVTTGINLETAIQKGIIKTDTANKMYYRGFRLSAVENTLFHIIGEHKELLEDVANVSEGFFSHLVDKETPTYDRMKLLRNLLQITGWGNIKVKMDKKEVVVVARNMPYSLKQKGDNWKFLSCVILGFLRSSIPKSRIKDYRVGEKRLRIVCSL